MAEKLHILFLCGWYPSRVLPINGDFIQRHAEAVSLKHQVTVLHIVSDNNTSSNIEIIETKTGEVKELIAYIKPTKNPLLKIYLFFKAYKSLLKKIDYFDLVHLNSLYPFGVFALHLKWFNKISYIISEHWSGYHLPQSNDICLSEKVISKLITSNSTYVCPVSLDLGNSMRNFGLKGNYKRVPNVVDTNLFVPLEKVSNTFTLVHISSMVEVYKNISGILRVIAKLQDHISKFKIKFIGESSQKLIPRAKELGINSDCIEFVEQIPHHKVIQELQEADCILLFSNYENLPCVILEAFATGTHVISTDAGGIKEFFPDDFGLLIEKGNEESLLKSILKVYNNEIIFSPKDEMHKYADANFSKEKICQSFSELYHDSLNK